MAFDENWETLMSQKEWGKYPNEEVIRVTAMNFYSSADRKAIKILDLGCGGGANTWYFAREGFSVYGIDGSVSAIRQTSAYLQRDNLSAVLTVGDIENLDFEDDYFDAVYDIGAIQHNNMTSIQRIYQEVSRVLKPGGLFFSMCINDMTSGKEEAEQVESNTYLHLKSINADVLVHLFSEEELQQLMASFDTVVINSILQTFGNKKQIGHYLVSGFWR